MKNIPIANQLIESFGYESSNEVNEDGVWDTAKKYGGKILSKAALPINAAVIIYEAWNKIKEMGENAPNMSKEVYRSNVAKIIGELVAEFGLFTVGMTIGGILGGLIGTAGGPTALVTGFAGAIAGGMAVNIAYGNDANKLVNDIVDKFYPQGANKLGAATAGPVATKAIATATPSAVGSGSNEMKSAVATLQNKLNNAGYKISSTGNFDKETVGAIQAYRKASGAKNDFEAFNKLLSLSESVNYATMSESEKMSYLKNKLTSLDEATVPSWIANPIERVIGKSAGKKAAEMLGDRVYYGKEFFKREANGTTYISSSGKRASAEDLQRLGAKPVQTAPSAAPTAPAASAPPAATTAGKGVPTGTRHVDHAASGEAVTYSKDAAGWNKYNSTTKQWERVNAHEAAEIERRAAAHVSGTPGAAAATAEEIAAIPNGSKAVEIIKKLGGKIFSRPMILAIASLLAMHYFWGSDGNITTDDASAANGAASGAGSSSATNTAPTTSASTTPSTTSTDTPLSRFYNNPSYK